MRTISPDQAREEVWSRLFASKCIKLTQEQWDMIFALQHSDRVPRKLQPRLERALLLREQLNQQLYEADKWLRLHVENYEVVPVHSTNAEAPTGGLTGGALAGKTSRLF